MTPAARWSADELARRALLKQGVAVAVHLRRHHALIAWAKERGLFLRVDRATPWGNPFELGKDALVRVSRLRWRLQRSAALEPPCRGAAGQAVRPAEAATRTRP